MAKAKVNKAATVRDLFAATPDASAREVIAALKKKGISISEAHVYAIKSGMKKQTGKKRGRPPGKPQTKPAAKAQPSAADAVLKVKGLANELGGMDNLKKLVEAISE